MYQSIGLWKNCQNIYFNIDKIRNSKLKNHEFTDNMISEEIKAYFKKNMLTKNLKKMLPLGVNKE